MTRLILSAALLAALAAPGYAQQTLKLDIHDGHVSLDAAGVPARQILAEWARVGGTKVVGGEKVTGTLLTLRLVNVPERQALDIILRNVAGYMAAPRLASATPGASGYDRILILPTSTVANNAPSNAAGRMPSNPGSFSGMERRVPPRPPGMTNAEPDVDVEPIQPEVPDPNDLGFNGQPPVFTFPQPQPQQQGNQLFVPVPQGGFGVPGQPGAQQQPVMLQPGTNGQPTIYNFVPTTPGQPPANGGFGVIGSPTPGVIQAPPVQPGQVAPPPPRPPGGK